MCIKPDFKELCFIFRVTRFPVLNYFSTQTEVRVHQCLAASPELGKELCLIRHTRSALCAAAAAQPPPCFGSMCL